MTTMFPNHLETIITLLQTSLPKEWYYTMHKLDGVSPEQYLINLMEKFAPVHHLLLFEVMFTQEIPQLSSYEISSVSEDQKTIEWNLVTKNVTIDPEHLRVEEEYFAVYHDQPSNQIHFFLVDQRIQDNPLVPPSVFCSNPPIKTKKKAKAEGTLFTTLFSFIGTNYVAVEAAEEEITSLPKPKRRTTSKKQTTKAKDWTEYPDEEEVDIKEIKRRSSSRKKKEQEVVVSDDEKKPDRKKNVKKPHHDEQILEKPKNTRKYVKKTVAASEDDQEEEEKEEMKTSKKIVKNEDEEPIKKTPSVRKSTTTNTKKKKVLSKATKVMLPVRVHSSFTHPLYGPVTITATLFYIDKMPDADYIYRHIVDDELFVPVSKDLMTPGIRVCMFHVIEDVQPAVSPLQYLVGCWFSSFQISSNLMGNRQSAWESWTVTIDNQETPLWEIFRSPSPTHTFTNHSAIHEKYINFKRHGETADEKNWLWKAGDFRVRDLMAVLCINECDEHTCHPNMFLKDTSETSHWNGDPDQWCKHKRINGFDETKNGGGLTIYQDPETTAKFNIESDRNNSLKKPNNKTRTKKEEITTDDEEEEEIIDEDDDEQKEGVIKKTNKKKPAKRRTKKQIRKIDKEFHDQIIRDNENTMRSGWGQRITFDTMDPTCRIDLFHHPFYFRDLFAFLTTIRDERGLEMLIPYQFTHFLDTRFVVTQDDYNQLNKYFTCFEEETDDDGYFLSASRVGPNYTKSNGDTHILMKWQLREPYYRAWDTNLIYFSRMSDDEMHTVDRRYYLYVPMPVDLVEQNHLVKTCDTTEEMMHDLYEWAIAPDNPESFQMQDYQVRLLQLADIMEMLEDETRVSKVDHRLKTRLEVEITKSRHLLFCEQSLFNEINLDYHSREEMLIFVTKIRARFTFANSK